MAAWQVFQQHGQLCHAEGWPWKMLDSWKWSGFAASTCQNVKEAVSGY